MKEWEACGQRLGFLLSRWVPALHTTPDSLSLHLLHAFICFNTWTTTSCHGHILSRAVVRNRRHWGNGPTPPPTPPGKSRLSIEAGCCVVIPSSDHPLVKSFSSKNGKGLLFPAPLWTPQISYCCDSSCSTVQVIGLPQGNALCAREGPGKIWQIDIPLSSVFISPNVSCWNAWEETMFTQEAFWRRYLI